MKSNSPASTKFDSAYLEIAGIIARQSTCVRVKVGAVITVNNRIVSTGYNGVPSGMKHCAEVFSSIEPMSESQFLSSHHEFSSKFELHAEQNAIAFCAKRGVSVEGGTLYVTITPCQDCLKLIKAAGIVRVVAGKLYDRDDKEAVYARAASFGIDLEIKE